MLPILSFVFGKIFFPDPNPIFTILAIYGTLSLSLLGRVIGGLFFGRLSDLYGRRPVIIITSLCLSVSMIVFGYYLPFFYVHSTTQTNTMINFAYIPPMVFVILRIVIGFLIGGVWPTAGTLAIENIFQNHKYLFIDCKNKKGEIVESEKIQKSSKILDKLITTAKLDERNVLKAFKDMDNILEKLFNELSDIGKINLDKKIKLKKYSYDFAKNIGLIKEENLQEEKLKSKNLKKIAGLSEQLKNELETLSDNATSKLEYNLSNLIINIKEIEKLVYIEKLRVMEIASKDKHNLKKIKELRKYDRMEKLTWQSGVIQFGFSLGLLVAALIGSNFQNNILNKSLLDYLQIVYYSGGFAGLIWFVILLLFLKESVILKYEMGTIKNLRHFIGIRELLENEKTRKTLFNFWLIMTGLMYLYYSTIIVAPDILHRNGIMNWNASGIPHAINLKIPGYMTLSTQFAIVSIISHLGMPILCFALWKNKSMYNIIFGDKRFNTFYKNLISFFQVIKDIPIQKKYFLDLNDKSKNAAEKSTPSKDRLNQEEKSSLKLEKEIENVDVKFMILLGIILIILGIIVFCVFYFLLTKDGESLAISNIIITITMLVIFFGNAGFGIIPSMLASRFPIHLRNIQD